MFYRFTCSNISHSETAMRTKGRIYQALVCSILLYGCETWPVRGADERILEIFDNDRKAQRLWAICGTASPPLPNKHTGIARAGFVLLQDVPKVS